MIGIIQSTTGGNDCGKIQLSIAMLLNNSYSSAMVRDVPVYTVVFFGDYLGLSANDQNARKPHKTLD
jgi:hypothetical protein